MRFRRFSNEKRFKCFKRYVFLKALNLAIQPLCSACRYINRGRSPVVQKTILIAMPVIMEVSCIYQTLMVCNACCQCPPSMFLHLNYIVHAVTHLGAKEQSLCINFRKVSHCKFHTTLSRCGCIILLCLAQNCLQCRR